MSRPLYETQDNIDDERRIVEEVAAACGAYWAKLPRLSVIDYVLCKGPVAVRGLEVKRRRVPRSHYPTLTISKKKIDRAMVACCALNLPLLLAIGWDDGTFVYRFDELIIDTFDVVTGGRADRDDPKDIEEMYAIPTANFKPLGKA